ETATPHTPPQRSLVKWHPGLRLPHRLRVYVLPLPVRQSSEFIKFG
ncbi:hypothetical protein I8752_20765, partial [Nostocaceae cyanobacterium CENA369]|nr:hypothetical protein [Dendronalium phyllosphericum CENA369]